MTAASCRAWVGAIIALTCMLVPFHAPRVGAVPMASACGSERPVVPRGREYGVRAVVALGDAVLAATDAGILRGQNGGRLWTAPQPAQDHGGAADAPRDVVALASAPGGGRAVYAVTAQGRVFQGDWHGCAWTPRGSIPGAAFSPNSGVAVSPANDAVLVAACNRRDLCRSSDGGSTWQDVLAPPHDPVGWPTFALARWAGSTLYAGGWWQRGLYRSTDGGVSWTLLPGIGSYIDGVASLHGQTIIAEGWCLAACKGLGDPVEVLDGAAVRRVSGGPTVTGMIAGPDALYGSNGSTVIRLAPGALAWQRETISMPAPVNALAVTARTLVIGTSAGLVTVALPFPRTRRAEASVTDPTQVHGVPAMTVHARGFAAGETVLATAYAHGQTLTSSTMQADAAGTLAGMLPVPYLKKAYPFAVALTGLSSGAAAAIHDGPHGALRARPARPDVWAALMRLNYWRAAIGAQPLALDPRLQQASDLDSAYLDQNIDTPECQRLGCGHHQAPGLPGYSGAWPSDRCAATGYPWGCGAEALGQGTPVKLVDTLVATVFHRVIILDPNAQYVGIGSVYAHGHRFVPVDPGAGPGSVTTRAWWAFPSPRQHDVPVAQAGEIPDPLLGAAPRGAHGDPITFSFHDAGDDLVRIDLRLMRGGVAGHAVSTYVFHADNKVWRGTAWAISRLPLCPASTYRVRATLRVGSRLTPQQWEFTTAGARSGRVGPCAGGA